MNRTLPIRQLVVCIVVAVAVLVQARGVLIKHVSGKDEPTVRDEVQEEEVQEEEEVPEIILVLKKELEQLLEKTHPNAIIRMKGTCLTAEFNTRTFSVHGIGKDGDAKKGLFERTGPTADGFIVEMSVSDDKHVPQASANETDYGEYRRLYWNTYRNEFQIHKENKYVRLHIDYGLRRDKKILDDIVRILMRRGDPVFITPWKRQPSEWGGS